MTSHWYFEKESFIVHNGVFEEYIGENKSVLCDALNLNIKPDFRVLYSHSVALESTWFPRYRTGNMLPNATL